MERFHIPSPGRDWRWAETTSQLWRILEVRIHDHRGIAVREIQAGRDGGLMAEIPAEIQDLQTMVGCAHSRQDAAGCVGAAEVPATTEVARTGLGPVNVRILNRVAEAVSAATSWPASGPT